MHLECEQKYFQMTVTLRIVITYMSKINTSKGKKALYRDYFY